MTQLPSDLGERILLATRLAVTAHWEQALSAHDAKFHTRQHNSADGIAELTVTDDLLPTATDGGAGSPPAPPVPPSMVAPHSTESSMIYGMYLSASGVVANSYRQDVISNNLANAETTGFKRDLATFYQRPTEAQARGVGGNRTNPLLEHIGGGILAMPTMVDSGQGDLEETGNNLDVAVQGKGFFTVQNGKETHLTRDGKFITDRDGYLTMASDRRQKILDPAGQPIRLDPTQPTSIGDDGTIVQNGKPVSKIGVFDVPNPRDLTKVGGQLMAVSNLKSLVPSESTLRSQFLERANVDPATELTELMETQRNLEANANMIRYQDQMLDKLVNQVGRIG